MVIVLCIYSPNAGTGNPRGQKFDTGLMKMYV